MTNQWNDIKNAFSALVFSNPAENHPVSMKWLNEARRTNNATVVVVDPRKTRMTALADQHVRIRPGTDIAFVNGLIKKALDIIESASTAAVDAAVPGVPGANLVAIYGIAKTTGVPANFMTNDTSAAYLGQLGVKLLKWPRYADALMRLNSAKNDYLRYGRDIVAPAIGNTDYDNDPNKEWVAENAATANAVNLPVLAPDLNPGTGSQTVYQYMKNRVSGYDAATVRAICGCSETEFNSAAAKYLSASWFQNRASTPWNGSSGYKAATILYAMGTTQHTYGSQNIKCYANLQIVTGNMGKHGGGVNALRGIANVQGSTDQGLLNGNMPGYNSVPAAIRLSSAALATDTSFKSKTKVAWTPGAFSGTGGAEVRLGGVNGLMKAGANKVTITGRSGPVPDPGGEYTYTLSGQLGAVGAINDKVYLTYESWLKASSFGGNNVWPGSGTASYANPYAWAGKGLNWGHAAMWSVSRLWFSDGSGQNTSLGAGATASGTPANQATEELYDLFMPKGGGLNHREMFSQMDPTIPGYSSAKPRIKGMLCWGQNPRVTEPNTKALVEPALKKLQWLAVVDMFLTETADVRDGTSTNGGLTYLLPAASFAEKCGTMTNSGRLLQWKYQVVAPEDGPVPGSKTDMEILFKLARAVHRAADAQTNKLRFGYADGQTAYEKIWKSQYADAKTFAGSYSWAGLNDPATAWDKDEYRASIQGEDNGIGVAGLGYPGLAERVFAQMSTRTTDDWGNAGTNWLQGSRHGTYGAWLPVGDGTAWTTSNMSDKHDLTRWNRAQSRIATAGDADLGLHMKFGWVWLRNRRIFYSKAFAPADVNDIYVTAEEVGKLFIGITGNEAAPAWNKYSGAWRENRKLGEADGYMPKHWEPHETTYDGNHKVYDVGSGTWVYSGRANFKSSYGQVGDAPTAAAGTSDSYPYTLTTFRHTEHFQGGPMTRNIAWLNELVPKAVVEINSVDAYTIGKYLGLGRSVRSDDKIWLSTARASKIGPFYAVVAPGGLQSSQKVGIGVIAIPWHWGNRGLATGPTANDLTIDALDTNMKMPESKACICKVSKAELVPEGTVGEQSW